MLKQANKMLLEALRSMRKIKNHDKVVRNLVKKAFEYPPASKERMIVTHRLEHALPQASNQLVNEMFMTTNGHGCVQEALREEVLNRKCAMESAA